MKNAGPHPPSHKFSLMSSPFFYTSPFFLFISLPPSPLLFSLPFFLSFFCSPIHSKSPPLPLKHGKVKKWVWGDTMSPTMFFIFLILFFLIFFIFRFFLSPPTFSLLSPFFFNLDFSPPSHEFSLMSSPFFLYLSFFFLLLSLPPSPLLFGSSFFLPLPPFVFLYPKKIKTSSPKTLFCFVLFCFVLFF